MWPFDNTVSGFHYDTQYGVNPNEYYNSQYVLANPDQFKVELPSWAQEPEEDIDYLTTKQLNKALAPYGNLYNSNSLIGQYRNANALQTMLDAMHLDPSYKGGVSEQEYASRSAINKGQKIDALQNIGLTALMGVGQVANNYRNAAQGLNLSYLQPQMNNISRIGTHGYNTAGQIANEYEQMNNISIPRYKDVKTTDKQKWAGALSSGVAGYKAATDITGNPLIGAGVGLVTGLGNLAFNKIGDERKHSDIQAAQNGLQVAQANARLNTGAAIDSFNARNSKIGSANVAADGGKITLREFADKILGNQKKNSVTRSSGIKTEKVKGGLKVKLRK